MQSARKRTLELIFACVSACAALDASAQQPRQPNGHTVTVVVHGVLSDAGTIRGQLCTDQAAFGVSECPAFKAVVPASPGDVKLVFNKVPSGVYAFSVWHDENGDERTQVFSEPFAFGNESRALPPVFDDAAFKVDADMTSSTTLFRLTG